MGCLALILIVAGIITLPSIVGPLIFWSLAAIIFVQESHGRQAQAASGQLRRQLKEQNQLLSDQILATSDPEAYKALVAERVEDAERAKKTEWIKRGAIGVGVLVILLIWAANSANRPSHNHPVSALTDNSTATTDTTPAPTTTPTSTPDESVAKEVQKAKDQWKEPEFAKLLPNRASSDTPEVRRAEPVVSPPPSTENAEQLSLIMGVNQALNTHDWRTLTGMTVNGQVNYFGHLHASDTYIAKDMQGDSRNYQWIRSTFYPNTFTHEVSNEYSLRWTGPMLYDSITVYSEALEKNGKLHKATTRLTVGYVTGSSGRPAIYALALKVLRTQVPNP